MSPKRRFLELDGLRGIAALWVVLFHYTFGTDFLAGGLKSVAARDLTLQIPNLEGLRAVDLFFIISGFVIFMTLENTSSLMDFAVSRVSRLYPTFLFAVTMTSAILVAVPFGAESMSWSRYLVNLTMLEQYVGVAPVEPVYWSLTFELGFYFCIGLVFACGAIERIEWIGALWVVFSALALKIFPMVGGYLPWRLQALTALPYASLFFSGILFYRVWREGFTWQRGAMLFACYLEYILFRDIEVVLILSGIYAAFALCVAGKAKFLSWKPLTFLGSISYALYLVHGAFGLRIQLLNYRLGMPPAVNLAAAICMAVVLASAVTYFIDKPAHRALNRAYRSLKRRLAVPVPEANLPH